MGYRRTVGARSLRIKRPARERCIGHVLGRSGGNVAVKHIKLEGDIYLGVCITGACNMSMVGPQRDTAHPPEIAPPRAEDRLLGGDAACVISTMI